MKRSRFKDLILILNPMWKFSFHFGQKSVILVHDWEEFPAMTHLLGICLLRFSDSGGEATSKGR